MIYISRASYQGCACCYASKPWGRDVEHQFGNRTPARHSRRVSESANPVFQRKRASCLSVPEWTLFWTASCWTRYHHHLGPTRLPGPPSGSGPHRLHLTWTGVPAWQLLHAADPPPAGTPPGPGSRPPRTAAAAGGGAAGRALGRRSPRGPSGGSCGGSCRQRIWGHPEYPRRPPAWTRRSRRARGRRFRRRGSWGTLCTFPWRCFGWGWVVEWAPAARALLGRREWAFWWRVSDHRWVRACPAELGHGHGHGHGPRNPFWWRMGIVVWRVRSQRGRVMELNKQVVERKQTKKSLMAVSYTFSASVFSLATLNSDPCLPRPKSPIFFISFFRPLFIFIISHINFLLVQNLNLPLTICLFGCGFKFLQSSSDVLSNFNFSCQNG